MNNGRILGVDFGLKNVGLAIANLSTKIASPFKVLRNNGKEQLAKEIFSIIQEWGIDFVVFGLPLNMKDEHSVNPVYTVLMDFVEFFQKKYGIDCKFMDERLSTFEAKEVLKFSGKISANKDSVSAKIILDKFMAGEDENS